MVAPFAPHLGEECWELLGNNKGGGISFVPWVEWKEELCTSDTVTLGVQVTKKNTVHSVRYILGRGHYIEVLTGDLPDILSCFKQDFSVCFARFS